MTSTQSRDFILSLPKDKQKKAAEIIESAMDTVETYWASNNEAATRKANTQRRKFRALCKEIKEKQ